MYLKTPMPILPFFFKRRSTFLSLLCFSGFLSGAVAQTVVFETGFEEPEYVKGDSLKGQGEWSVSSENPEGVIISESTGSIEPPQGTQMLEVTRQVGTQIPVAGKMFVSLREALKDDFTVSFLVTADAYSNAALKVGIGSSLDAVTGAWVGLRRAENQTGFGFYDQNGESASWEQIGEEIAPLDIFVRFEVTIHADTLTFSVKVFDADHTLLAEREKIPLMDSDGHLAAGQGFNRILIAADQHGQTRFYLDDIKIQQTP